MSQVLEHIELVVFDVDGVLTDGGILFTGEGGEAKRFDAADGAGIKYLQRGGVKVAFLTGRESEIVSRRAAELGVVWVEQGARKKLPALERILDAAGAAPERTAYVGDDLVDLPVMEAVGWSAAPAGARAEVRAAADHVCAAAGGRGAAREVCELVLKAQGKWDALVEEYRQAGRAWRGGKWRVDSGQ